MRHHGLIDHPIQELREIHDDALGVLKSRPRLALVPTSKAVGIAEEEIPENDHGPSVTRKRCHCWAQQVDRVGRSRQHPK